MAEMTPEERAAHIEALGPPTYKGKTLWFRSDKVLARISAAVQAEHERTKESIAKTHDQRAIELDLLDEVMNKGKPVTYSPEANWHRQQAAAIRALPEHGAERGKEEG